jgi:uncharacterized protein YfaS (alpha-2-macroglobulin family)
MRRIPVRFWIVSALLVAINIGGWLWVRQELLVQNDPATRPLRLVSALPAQNVDATDRLSLVFDSDVCSPELLNQPLAASPFTIVPELPGHWVWSEPKRLDFVLHAPLPAGRKFLVQPAADLDLQTGRVVQAAAEIEFQTRPLKLEECQLQSADSEHVNLELRFNQKVNPDELLQHLKVTEANTPASDARSSGLHAVSLVQEPSEKLTIRCSGPRLVRHWGTHINVLLDAALKGHGGDLPLGELVSKTLDLSTRFSLLRAEAGQPHFDDHVNVELYFSRDLDPRQALPEVKVIPVVEGLTIRIERQRFSDAVILTLNGRFEPGKQYTLAISPALLSKDGHTLGENQRATFVVPDRHPSVRLPADEGILTPHGNLLLDVQTVNVGGLKLAASRVHANNLISHLQGRYSQQTSRPVAERVIHIDQRQNVLATTPIDLRQLLGTPLGIYRVEASATDRTWTSDSAIVKVTDLAVTLKQERGGMLAWVTSLRTAEPVGGVKVSALSYNNQTLATAVSEADGTARLAITDKNPDGTPWAIVAESATDLAYLLVNQRNWVLDDVDQSGRAAPTTYDVMLYTERGAYRPGDTLHVTGIIRDVRGEIPPAFPLSIGVTRPDGRQVAELTATPDPAAQGLFHLEFPTRADCQTGAYRFTASLPGSQAALGSVQALVETFMPVRMEVMADTMHKRFGPEERPTIEIEARYLFGQPAASLPLVATGTWQRIPFVSEMAECRGFTFGDSHQASRVPIAEIKEILDAKGRATVEVASPATAACGLWRGTLAATVTEPGGRSVSKNVAVLLDTADRHIGLRLPLGNVVSSNTPVKLEWIQRTGLDAAAAPGPIDFSVVRVEYDTGVRRVHGRLVWNSVERLIPIWKGAVAAEEITGAAGSLPLTCPTAGTYRVVAVDRISGSTTQLEFWAGSDTGDRASLAMNRPERLEITLDKESYVPGSIAKVVVKSPFAGTMLLCVESDHILNSRIVRLRENTTTLELPVDAGLRGGAFITASVVRAVEPADSTWLPHRAMGMARLVTDHAANALPVAILAPSQSRPGETMHVVVQTKRPDDPNRPGVVHLWAVDEGVLLTTAFKTPDPWKHFLGQRKAGVSTADAFADLLPDHQRPAGMARIGGDTGDEVDALRRGPVIARSTNSHVVWRAAVPVDSEGRALFDFELPKLNGELRLMAVAADGDSYGATQHSVTLTSPLLVETAWPRFAAPHDEFQVPVKVFNSTDQPLMVQIALKSDGPLGVTLRGATMPDGISTGEHNTIAVNPREPVTLWLNATTSSIGDAAVTVTATTTTTEDGLFTAVSESRFPVRPATPLHSVSRFFKVEAGQPLSIAPPAEFLPATTRHTVSIGTRPTVQLRPAVEQLIEYPYGCLEQTSSRIVALLTANRVLGLLDDEARRKAIAEMIDAGIARLWSMQTRSGGLAYWPGNPETNTWGTIYSAGVLLEAAQAGHRVDARFLNELTTFLKAALTGRSGGELDDNQKAQICRFLAARNEPHAGWMARLSERIEHLDLAGRADLAAAWRLAGRKDRALASLPDDTIEQTVAPSYSGRLTSQVRQEAVLLSTLLEIDPDHRWVPILARKLDAASKNGAWGNTLENATALAALARYQTLAVGAAEFSGEVRAGDSGPFQFDHSKPSAFSLDGPSPIEIASSGQGNLYVTVTTTGLLAGDQVKSYDWQLQVRRTWTDRHGQPIDPESLKVGDLIQVAVTLKATGHDEIDNIAIVDALPGGMEVENPRLATSATGTKDVESQDWETEDVETLGKASQADHVEFLDDRVVLFATAGKSERTFRYALRVVTTGSFVVPPIQASCMYNAGYASVSGGGKVTIGR